ncbi:MAG: hypothetical protein J5618_01740, partial [Bacilli bacterium]|nr:hypothetical protein [Bacilli bacterium]
TVYYKVFGDENHNDTAEASVAINIANAASSVTAAPTAKTGLEYTGSAQELVNAGTATGGTLMYKLGENGIYSESIPTATNAGNYTVYYKVFGDENHNDTDENSVVVNIAKVASSVTAAPTAKDNLASDGTEVVELINAGTATGGTIQYKLNDGEYSSNIPTVINPGVYTIYYKVVGDENHNDIAEESFNVTVVERIHYRAWNGTSVVDVEGGCINYTVITESTTTLEDGVWYVLKNNVTIPTRITVNGNAHIILCDGCTLTASEGMTVNAENTLNIYGQTAETGKIVATGINNTAGIGGGANTAGGMVNIHGGIIEATGGNHGAGIGGGYKNGGYVNIYGGEIVARGGFGGAGIGGGAGYNGGTVNVHGGTVTAIGNYAVGIGAGIEGSSQGELIVDEGIHVFGGTSADDLEEKTNYDTQRWDYMLIIAHVHDWSYVANGASITATCGNDNCPVATGLTLTLTAPIDYVYDGTANTASFEAGYNNAAFANPTISYYLNNTLVAECINAGTYEARVTFGGQTAVLEFVIAQATPTGYDLPTGLEATYGDKLSDVTLPAGWSWKTPADEVGNVGDREHVAIYTPADVNYKAVEESLTIAVATADPTYTKPTGLEGIFGQTLSDVTLPSGWTWNDPTISVGNVGEHNFDATYTPSDPNYHAKSDALTITVNQAIPTGYDIPTGLAATYGDDVSSVTLPTNWSWKSSTDKVGNAGDREHVAIYTPADTNYKAVEETLTIAVAKATPTYVAPKDIEAPYDVTLSKVALPEGFSWMDNTQVVNKWGEQTYKAKFTPSDTANYNVIENIDIKVNVKWILVDPTQGDVNVTISDGEVSFDVNIKVEVKVKTEISVDQKRTDYANLATESFVSPNEDIMAIYDVKLIRTTNGVEEEIQPSDIKEGTTIYVQMAIPEELVGKSFRLLHIHNADDIVEVTNYFVSQDGKTLTVVVDRLSEFAFVGALPEGADNGFDYNTTPVWAVVLLIIFGILLLIGLFFLFILLKKKDDDDDDEEKKEPVKAMSIAFIAPLFVILNAVNGVVIAFIVVAVLTVLVWGADAFLFIKRKNNKKEQVKEEPVPAIEEKEELESSKEEPAPKEEQKVKEVKDEPKVEKKKTTRTLKETIAVASSLSSSSKWNKETIAKALKESHGDEVEINTRGNFTSTGLPLADTHYAVDKETRKCFIYVYETSGAPLLLINADDKLMDEVKEKHSDVSRSAFPKSKDDWYSIPLDDSYTDKEVQVILDYAHALALGRNEQGLSIKDSLAMASASKGVHTFNKLAVVEYLSNYKEVETNNRKNFTSTGLPLADTHYLTDEKGKKSCFIYVYETSGAMMFLIKANDEFVDGYKDEHQIISRSAFPKSKDKWYTVVLDESYSDDDVKKLLDDLIAFNK